MTIPNPASLSEIFAEFGLPANSRFPTDLYGLVGAPTSGPLAMSFFYGKTKPPTSLPTVSQPPSVSPTSGFTNETQLNATDGTSPDGALVDARWMLDSSETPATGGAIVPNAPGGYRRRNIFRNAAGDTVVYSNSASIINRPPAVTFSPPPGFYNYSQDYNVDYPIIASVPVKWNYTLLSGAPVTQGSSVTIADGATSDRISFGLIQTQAGGTRRASWAVKATIGSSVYEWTLELQATGLQDGGQA